MKKLLAMLLVLAIGLGCTSVIAELKVPLTTVDIPNVQAPVKIPEFEVVCENGYAILVTDWFDDVMDITDSVDNKFYYSSEVENRFFVTRFTYHTERNVFISTVPMEYTSVDCVSFSKRDKDGNFFQVSAFYPETGEAFQHTTLEKDVWDRLSVIRPGYPLLQCYNSNYHFYWYWNESVKCWEDNKNQLSVFFDEVGNAVSYKYTVPGTEKYSTTVQYAIDGNLEAAQFYVGGAWCSYAYNDVLEAEEWSYNYNSDTKPEGYSVEKLREMYPPLVGGKPVTPVSGDVNGNGEVELTDVLGVSKYLAGEGKTIDLRAANVNGDYSVNTKDILHLMQYFAGWDVELK